MSEDLIIQHCAPTLAGIKTGSLFTCSYMSEDEIKKHVRNLNQILVPKGLRILLLRYFKNRALIYVYRPSRLKNDFSDKGAEKILSRLGYSSDNPNQCIARLADKLHRNSDFPHEIGLFLGYPPEDVQGFIDNRARNCKMTGYWKVYGDEVLAKKLFEKYRRCTNLYAELWAKERSIERLTVAV